MASENEDKGRPAGSRLFTPAELLRFDGREGRPAFVSYGGLVFDVSGSSLWKEGRHQDRHDAGRDLTAAFRKAPHSTSILLSARTATVLRANARCSISTREDRAHATRLPAART